MGAPRITRQESQHIRTLYQAGIPVADIASRTGRSKAGVYELLTRYGLWSPDVGVTRTSRVKPILPPTPSAKAAPSPSSGAAKGTPVTWWTPSDQSTQSSSYTRVDQDHRDAYRPPMDIRGGDGPTGQGWSTRVSDSAVTEKPWEIARLHPQVVDTILDITRKAIDSGDLDPIALLTFAASGGGK